MIRIGIIGDFNPEFESHRATDTALQHAAEQLGLTIEAPWIPTPSITGEDALSDCGGILAAPGSPYQSMSGMLRGIEFARTRNLPFLGTCGGFQYALLEFARNVLGFADADSAENSSGSSNIVISPVACAVPNRAAGDPKLVGSSRITISKSSMLHAIYGSKEADEVYFCNFEVNPEYESKFENAGLHITARGPQGECRAVELPSRRFFLATLFQPQRSSSPGHPHPVLLSFLRSIARPATLDTAVAATNVRY